MNKLNTLCMMAIMLLYSSLSMAQCLSRAKSYGGPAGAFSGEYGWSLIHAPNGYYVSGSMGLYRDTAYSIDFGGLSLDKPFDADKRPYHFLLSYQDDGTLNWGKVIAKGEGDAPNSVINDKDGNLILIFSFRDTLNWGGSFTSLGKTDIAISKLSPDGTPLWVKTGGSKNSDVIESVSTDNEGNYYISGMFFDTLKFGTATLINPIEFSYTGFLIKLNNAGEVVWSKLFDQYKALNAYGIGAKLACDNNGNLFWAGRFKDTLTINDKTIYSNQMGSPDAFLAQLATGDGKANWLIRLSANKEEQINGLICLSSGKAVLTGHFTDTLALAGTDLISKGGTDGFIAQINADGTLAWAKSGGGKREDRCFNAVYANEHIYVSAYADSLAQYGNLSTDTGAHTIIIKLNPGGEAQQVITGGKGDYFYYPAVSVKGNQLITTGTFSNGGKSTPFGADTLKATGYRDMFIWHACDSSTGTGINSGVQLGNSPLIIYPNPFSEVATMEVRTPQTQGSTLCLYNVLGKKVYATTIVGQHTVLYRNGLAPGVYFYVLNEGQKNQFTGKLIIQ